MNYDKIINRNALEMKPSGIRKFFDVVSTMKDAISLGVGEPDFVTPWQIRDSAIRSIQKGYTQYTSNSGLLELRELISRYLNERFNLSYDPKNEILVTVGASEAIDLSLRVLVENGDEVLVPEPSYVSYSPCIALLGATPKPIRCVVENDFKMTAADVERAITKKTKAIILPYPNNPTGAIMEREHLVELANMLKKYPDIIVVSDEIYAELTYEKKHVSIAEIEGMRERTIIINGFSKAFAMTGWRLGYVCAPVELAKVILKVHQYVIMCAPTASQFAGISALKTGLDDNFEMVEKMRSEYDKRRRFMVESFNSMGLKCFNPLGAFYVFPCVETTGLSGEQFAEKLLMSKKVAVVPGSAFGDGGANFIRCSYASSMKNLDTAVERIEDFIKSGEF